MHEKESIVKTTYGNIEGSFEGGLYVFKGIPYARSTSGKNRWLPPQPLKPWLNVRETKSFGYAAPQNLSSHPILKNITIFKVGEPQSEDCLSLNIWTPGLDDARRPVLFWIHGGGFEHGSGSEPIYSGKILATRGNAVVITINYRLGLFGFLNFKEITAGKIPATGNEGLLDQIAALKWVHDNIISFGGDPENITVFGESAGGASIGCLLAIPEARGLFHKAILESGGASSPLPLEQAIEVAEEIFKLLNIQIKDAELLYSIPAKRLLHLDAEITQKYSSRGSNLPMRPIIDGNIIKEMPLVSIEQGSARDIPILIGSNLEEWKLYSNSISRPDLTFLDEAGLRLRCQKYSTERAEILIETYRTALNERGSTSAPGDVWTAIQTDAIVRIPAIRLAEAQMRHSKSIYSYLFDWRSPNPVLGSCHALELGFVFGTYDDLFCGSGYQAEILSHKIQDAWLAFSSKGDPSSKSLGDWKPYSKRRATMILGENCRLEKIPYDAERRAWDFVSNVTWSVP
jgi:para-nitrobenzyl esterase